MNCSKINFKKKVKMLKRKTAFKKKKNAIIILYNTTNNKKLQKGVKCNLTTKEKKVLH